MDTLKTSPFATKDDKQVDITIFKDVKLVCIYFSAHWCPPCRNFTPILAEVYNKINEKEKLIEIIFATRDKDLESYNEYRHTMPWVAIPFGHANIKTLATTCNITGIPTLVIMNQKGDVVCEDGYEDITSLKEKAFDKWFEKA